MAGVPPHSSIRDLIQDLFQNEHYKQKCVEEITTFSLAKLTQCQKDKLCYPPCFKPMDLFIVYQVDHYDADCKRESKLSLVSFAKKECNEHIYGLYFDLCGQERFHVKELWDSC